MKTQTLFVTVKRDNNPRREEANVWPWLGKLIPLSLHPLQLWGKSLCHELSFIKGKKVLLLGVAESGLIPSWVLAQEFAQRGLNVTLCNSTRESPNAMDFAHKYTLYFKEPHSHAPDQFVQIEKDTNFDHIIIVEDEITTGVSCNNILRSMSHLCKDFTLLTLCDPYAKKNFIQESNPTLNIRLMTPENCWKSISNIPNFEGDITKAIFVIGETVQDGLKEFVMEKCIVRHVSRSPWKVDSKHIYSRVELGKDSQGSSYFYYNYGEECKASIAIIYHSITTRPIARSLKVFLRKNNSKMKIIVRERTTFKEVPESYEKEGFCRENADEFSCLLPNKILVD